MIGTELGIDTVFYNCVCPQWIMCQCKITTLWHIWYVWKSTL